MRAVAGHGAPLVDDPARLTGVAALGVDETAYLAATASHGTEFATGLVDLTRTGRVASAAARRRARSQRCRALGMAARTRARLARRGPRGRAGPLPRIRH